MTPSASPASHAPTGPLVPRSRRRQRSARLRTAVLLVVIGALAVGGAALTGRLPVAVAAGALAVVLAAAAVWVVWSEVVQARRDAAADRADQARAYLELTETRTAEQAVYVAGTSGRIARLESTVSRLETRVGEAAAEVEAATAAAADAHRQLAEQQHHVETLAADRDRARARLEEAEDRAAQAIVRVAELEQELDVVIDEWRAGTRAPQRKHA